MRGKIMGVTFDEVYRMALQLSAADRRRLADELAGTPSGVSAREILDVFNAHAGELREMGVQRIGVFGSHVRGDASLSSDVDVLVAMADEPYSLLDLMGVKVFLEDLLGREVDIAPKDGLRPGLRDAILGEVVYAEDV
jgi:predicted nucleotidyltransferase